MAHNLNLQYLADFAQFGTFENYSNETRTSRKPAAPTVQRFGCDRCPPISRTEWVCLLSFVSNGSRTGWTRICRCLESQPGLHTACQVPTGLKDDTSFTRSPHGPHRETPRNSARRSAYSTWTSALTGFPDWAHSARRLCGRRSGTSATWCPAEIVSVMNTVDFLLASLVA